MKKPLTIGIFVFLVLCILIFAFLGFAKILNETMTWVLIDLSLSLISIIGGIEQYQDNKKLEAFISFAFALFLLLVVIPTTLNWY